MISVITTHACAKGHGPIGSLPPARERAFALMHVFSSRDGFSIDSFEAVDLSGDLIFLKCEKVPLA